MTIDLPKLTHSDKISEKSDRFFRESLYLEIHGSSKRGGNYEFSESPSVPICQSITCLLLKVSTLLVRVIYVQIIKYTN